MAGGPNWQMDWHGEEIALRVRRALGRGLIAIGENVAAKGKANAHVISGTMRRSIHTAERDYDGGDDFNVAGAGSESGSDVPNVSKPSEDGEDWILEVGSWVPYACVEECGRGHRFMGPAVEEVQGGMSMGIMAQAFAEEGLRV